MRQMVERDREKNKAGRRVEIDGTGVLEHLLVKVDHMPPFNPQFYPWVYTQEKVVLMSMERQASNIQSSSIPKTIRVETG